MVCGFGVILFKPTRIEENPEEAQPSSNPQQLNRSLGSRFLFIYFFFSRADADLCRSDLEQNVPERRGKRLKCVSRWLHPKDPCGCITRAATALISDSLCGARPRVGEYFLVSLTEPLSRLSSPAGSLRNVYPPKLPQNIV